MILTPVELEFLIEAVEDYLMQGYLFNTGHVVLQKLKDERDAQHIETSGTADGRCRTRP